jgi:GNAT superfamily N-acetyltransferase
VTKSLLRKFTEVDYRNRFAVVARADDEWVGIARYIATQPGRQPVTAEVALAVTPGWRDVGLGASLLELLRERAHECGIALITATFLADNQPVQQLADMFGGEVVVDHGVAEASGRVDRDQHLQHR